jgi:hypothetical protein
MLNVECSPIYLSLNPQPSTINHQPLRNPATNAGNFHQVIGPSLFISMFGPALRDWMFDVPLFI